MTTQWNSRVNEESRFSPLDLRAEKPSSHSNTDKVTPPLHSELHSAMEANEVFLAFLEGPPDYSHCGINE